MRIDSLHAHTAGQRPREETRKAVPVKAEAVHARVDLDMAGDAEAVPFARAREQRIVRRVCNGENQPMPRAPHDVLFAQRRAENEDILRDARVPQLCALFDERDRERACRTGEGLRDGGCAVAVCVRLDDGAELSPVRAR